METLQDLEKFAGWSWRDLELCGGDGVFTEANLRRVHVLDQFTCFDFRRLHDRKQKTTFSRIAHTQSVAAEIKERERFASTETEKKRRNE